jgi:hypothetical protein
VSGHHVRGTDKMMRIDRIHYHHKDAENPNTTQTLEYTKHKYNVKIRK